ncbi:GNAT family N-acetyltransferase [Pseudalkalibacillus sp. A8]|uniref:GNAT family N-acetyltransferase n=1 Tax=Pseudalkalibacillus sp. A8 TaxID=3382641 RepID=UPI0038B4C2B4
MLKIQLINPEDTYELRQKILRPEECKYEDDFTDEAFHLGAFSGENLISIASFYKENHSLIKGGNHYRLRGMATLEAFRNKQAGRSLIEFAEKELSRRDADVWWCNARTTVSGYYEKMGLQAIGEVFDIEPIGPHKLMYKVLR